jgi:hypothetical protein
MREEARKQKTVRVANHKPLAPTGYATQCNQLFSRQPPKDPARRAGSKDHIVDLPVERLGFSEKSILRLFSVPEVNRLPGTAPFTYDRSVLLPVRPRGRHFPFQVVRIPGRDLRGHQTIVRFVGVGAAIGLLQ